MPRFGATFNISCMMRNDQKLDSVSCRNLQNVRPANCKVLLAAICLTMIPSAVARNGSEQVQSGAVRRAAAGWRTIRMRVTAYCSCPKCCGKYSGGKTAGGHEVTQGDTFVAADKMHSFGTEMIIPGYNDSRPVEVLDRGGAIRGSRLDVFFNSHQEARQWGVRYLPVKVRVSFHNQ